MKVRLWTLEIDRDGRRAINIEMGRTGLATREEVRRYAELVLECAIDNLVIEKADAHGDEEWDCVSDSVSGEGSL